MEKKKELPGKVILSFKGKKLAEATSERGWRRFTALTLYLTTEPEGYILHVKGGTPHEGEEEYHRYICCKDPVEVVRVLKMRRRSRSHTDIALRLLRIAAKSDDGFKKEGRDDTRETGG